VAEFLKVFCFYILKINVFQRLQKEGKEKPEQQNPKNQWNPKNLVNQKNLASPQTQKKSKKKSQTRLK
jgi:hypothetical protein